MTITTIKKYFADCMRFRAASITEMRRVLDKVERMHKVDREDSLMAIGVEEARRIIALWKDGRF